MSLLYKSGECWRRVPEGYCAEDVLLTTHTHTTHKRRDTLIINSEIRGNLWRVTVSVISAGLPLESKSL